MVKKLLSLIIAATLGLWIASSFIPGIQVILLYDSNFFGLNLTAQWQIFLLLGIILGFINFFLKPALNIITLPLRIITLGLFGFVINMALIWIVDVMFQEFSAPLIWPLFYTSLIIFASNILVSTIFNKEKNEPR